MRTSNRQPINYAHVQMMINTKIATQDELAMADYLAKQPRRRAYFYEKLENLILRVSHHIVLHKRDKKNPDKKELAQSIQNELYILLQSNPGLAEHYGLTKGHQAMLLQGIN